MTSPWPVDPRGTGDLITAEDWNQHVDALTDLNSRVTTATNTNSTQDSQLTTLESRTTNPTTGNTQLGSRLTTVESRTTNASTGNTQLGTRVSTLETNQGTRGSNGTIYSEINTLKENSGGSVGPATYFRGLISSAGETFGSGTEALNLTFGASGYSYTQNGGFTVSGYEVHLPSNGLYLVQAQAVANAQSGATELGMYILKNGTGGNTDSVAAKEIQFSGVNNFTLDQISTVIPISNAPSDFIVFRLYSNVSRVARGSGAQYPYGSTHLTITRLGSLA